MTEHRAAQHVWQSDGYSRAERRELSRLAQADWCDAAMRDLGVGRETALRALPRMLAADVATWDGAAFVVPDARYWSVRSLRLYAGRRVTAD